MRMDIELKLLENRIIFFSEAIDPDSATRLISKILILNHEDSSQPINIYINSPGGDVTSTFAIYDAVRQSKADVHTTVVGQASSGASIIAVAGKKRFILQHAYIMIHQAHGSCQGQLTDIQRITKHYELHSVRLCDIYMKHTNIKSEQEVKELLDRDTYIYPEEAMKMGFVDEILCNDNNIAGIGLEPTTPGV